MKTVQIIKSKFTSTDYYGLMACNLDRLSIFPVNRDTPLRIEANEISIEDYLNLSPLPPIIHNGFFYEYFNESAFNFISPSLITEEEGYYKAFGKVCVVTNVIKTCTIPFMGLSPVQPDNNLFLTKSNAKTYIMIDRNTGLYKIGRSSNPNRRESTLQSEKPSIELITTTPIDIESRLHNQYKSKRVRGEWFRLSLEDICEIKSLFAEQNSSSCKN